MTTIAYDGRYVAADSLVVSGEIRTAYCKKIKNIPKRGNLPDDCIIMVSGAGAVLEAFPIALEENYPQAKVDCADRSYNAIVIYRDGSVDSYSQISGYPEPGICERFAMGSGREIALGAMAAGKSAAEAVAIAIELDIWSGGDILVFDTEEWCFAYK